jgi:thiol:disulfide interchange protein
VRRQADLLSISANWCHGCGVMDRVSYADPAVAAVIAAGFVPIRVDADRRPDINDRYNLDGWPTTGVSHAVGRDPDRHDVPAGRRSQDDARRSG